jgi:hypothetical protein
MSTFSHAHQRPRKLDEAADAVGRLRRDVVRNSLVGTRSNVTDNVAGNVTNRFGRARLALSTRRQPVGIDIAGGQKDETLAAADLVSWVLPVDDSFAIAGSDEFAALNGPLADAHELLGRGRSVRR